MENQRLKVPEASVCVRAPAKVNLFLAVTGRRADGYHELISLLCAVDLWDRLSFAFSGTGIAVHCQAPGIPDGEANIAHRAAALFCRWLEDRGVAPPTGIRISIDKRIPAGAGLGGGSSDAAAVLSVLNRHTGQPFSLTELEGLAMMLGADVPFFLHARPMLATGIGERLEPVADLPPRFVVIVFPGFSIATAAVYRDLNLELTKCGKKIKKNLLKNGLFAVEQVLCNDLEAVSAAKHPEIVSIKEQLMLAGASGALMSGSGSSVYGLFEDRGAARVAGCQLRANRRWQVFQTRLLT